MTVLMTGIAFGESPRWHDGRLWFSDWAAHQVIAVDPEGGHEVIASVPSFPMCIDFLPDGRLLVVDSSQRRLLRREVDSSMVTHANLAPISEKPWNDIVVDEHGRAYVNSIGFDFPGGEPGPGLVALVSSDGTVRQVADDLAFPNGMAITEDGATLLVGESYANRITAYDIGSEGALSNRRVWAEVDDHPDGICIDAEGAVWYADVGNRHCVRVREGGEILSTVELDRGAFACALSRESQPQLYVVAQQWGGSPEPGELTGQVLEYPAPAPGAGRP
jgi:sugar lactone lactonase YvrE